MGMNKAIGIDLGTTYSCVGVWQHDRVEIIVNDQGNRTTPSMVAFTSDDKLVGDAALFQISSNYHNTVFDVKRIIGRRFSDPSVEADRKIWPFTIVSGNDDKPMIEVDYRGQKKLFSAEEISSMVLAKMKKIAEDYLMCDVKDAVITVPAYFNDAQKRATRDACKIAGLNAMRIMSEPTAAAISYGSMREKKIKDIMIFDLGGGTFDVSVVRIHRPKIEVKAVGGDTHLGGEDFNNRLLDYCVGLFNKKYKMDMSSSGRALRRLGAECERAKRNLSYAVETVIEIDCLYQRNDLYVKISRAKFEELNADLFGKTIEILKQCLKDANMSKAEVSDIVLIGGSSRIPKLQELVADFFDGKELCKSMNPDEAVAHGAALQAAVLNKEAVDLVVVEVIPLSLGLASLNGIMEVIVPRNTCIPTCKELSVTTTLDNDTVLDFDVYEGERLLTLHNNFLGTFRLKGIEPAPSGVPIIRILFLVDADGVLTVSAQDRKTKSRSQIIISNEHERASKEKVEQLVALAQKFRFQDEIQERKHRAQFKLQCCIHNMKTRVTEAMRKGAMRKTVGEYLLENVNSSQKWLDHSYLSADVHQFNSKWKKQNPNATIL
ncbi:hypothetical protein KI387_017552 [Taxus chinensis]|uniref:Heat shock protein 70 n=1 Tax=Taxus chinensis TaxID=29808 RepID=A0AA38GJA2_TAXCH|nr:hypothetical protein KI387_017552 [Taxus chinensis]